jgi:hypothetical protein
MDEVAPNAFVVTCVKENEDGSADIEVEVGSEISEKVIEEGINFLLLKGILEATTEDILRWAQRGKQEERTDVLVKKFSEIYNEDAK